MLSQAVQAKRIVIKLGTQVVTQEHGGLALEKLSALAHQCAALIRDGREILLVSSGAVGMGRKALGLEGKISLNEKQACAAVGQSLLMDAYNYLFSHYGFKTAQLLLTALDFTDRQRYLNLRETMETLLKLKVIPIINENDTVSTMELQEEGRTKSFGDNDKLSSLVASKLGADLLVIFTNVDGIYSENPQINPKAQRLSVIQNLQELNSIRMDGQSAYGRGGMISKVEAARIAALSGIYTLVISGEKISRLNQLFVSSDGNDAAEHQRRWEEAGTLIHPQGELSEKKRWIGLACGYDGVIVVNAGARAALVEKNASLLPSGILSVQGEFQPRQVVSIQDETGIEIGRGMVNFSAEDTRRIQGCQSRDIPALLGPVENDVVIQRDYLVVF